MSIPREMYDLAKHLQKGLLRQVLGVGSIFVMLKQRQYTLRQ